MEHIIYSKEGAIARIQFNRPDKLNAFNEQMLVELRDTYESIKNDDAIKVIIVSGEGRAFSAGVDLKATSAKGFQKETPFMKVGEYLGELMVQIPKVTIAQVHGYCFTGALELMLFFDLAYCTEDTQFGDTHAKFAVMPRWGMTQRLARRVGINRAKEMTFRAMRVKGAEAERIGLVNRAFKSEELAAEVTKVAHEISENSFEAITKIKALYNGGWYSTLEKGLALELAADTRLADTDAQLAKFSK